MNFSTRLMTPLHHLRHGTFFYGWVIVVLAFFDDLMSAGAGGYTIGLYYRPLREDLGWDRSTVTVGVSIGRVLNGITAPFFGWAVDRFGARPVMIIGSIMGIVGLASIAGVQEPWHFYLLYGVVGSLGIAEFGSTTNSVALSKWFVRRRGRAIALAAMGVSAGGVVLIPILNAMIENVGWRLSWVLLGAMIFVVVTVPTILFMRSRPEDLGLLPDGDDPAAAPPDRSGGVAPAARAVHATQEISWTLQEALKTPAFWLLTLTFNFGSMAAGALVIHQIPYAQDKGFMAEAAAVGTLVAFVSFLVKPFWGFLMERVHARYCIMLAFAIAAAGVAAFRWAESLPMLYLYALLFGGGNGAFAVVSTVTWADYYGREFIGTIRGVTRTLSTVIGAGTPLFAAWVADTYHSYDFVMYTFIVAYMLGIISVYFARQPLHPSRREVAEPVLS